MNKWLKLAGVAVGAAMMVADEYAKLQRAKEEDEGSGHQDKQPESPHNQPNNQPNNQGASKSAKPETEPKPKQERSKQAGYRGEGPEIMRMIDEGMRDFIRAAFEGSEGVLKPKPPVPPADGSLPDGITEEDVAKYYKAPKDFGYTDPKRKAYADHIAPERAAAARRDAIQRAMAARAAAEQKAIVWDYETLREQYEMPAIALIRPYPPHRAAHGRSHFGGWPDLPSGIAWPRTANGEALHFMLQVDLEEMPWRPTGAPARGTLFFFAHMDEEMIVDDKDYLQQLVLFDPSSSGAPTPPPADIEAMDPRSLADNDPFGKAGEGVLPYWPLTPIQIASMPHAEALEGNSYHNPALHSYAEAYLRHRAAEIEQKAGLAPSKESYNPSLDVYEVRSNNREEKNVTLRLKSYDDPSGPPWLWRLVALFSDLMIRSTSRAASPPLVEAPEQAHAQHKIHHEALAWAKRATKHEGHERLDRETADAFASWVTACGVANAAKLYSLDQCFRQLVAESGADATLAAVLPDTLYDAMYPLHARSLATEIENIGLSKTGKTYIMRKCLVMPR